MASFNLMRTQSFNPLIPKIHIEILPTDLQELVESISQRLKQFPFSDQFY